MDNIHVRQQATAFGFACRQTAALMPLPIWLAHKLARQMVTARVQNLVPYLSPDAKTQVGVEYRGRRPFRIHSITVIASGSRAVSQEIPDQRLHNDIREAVIKPAFADEPLQPDNQTLIFINPMEHLMVGGPGGAFRAHRPEKRRRHLWRICPAQRQRLERQGPHAHRSGGGLCGALCRQKCGGRRPGGRMRGPVELFHRLCRAGQYSGGNLRQWQDFPTRNWPPWWNGTSIFAWPGFYGILTCGIYPRSIKDAFTGSWRPTARWGASTSTCLGKLPTRPRFSRDVRCTSPIY